MAIEVFSSIFEDEGIHRGFQCFNNSFLINVEFVVVAVLDEVLETVQSRIQSRRQSSGKIGVHAIVLDLAAFADDIVNTVINGIAISKGIIFSDDGSCIFRTVVFLFATTAVEVELTVAASRTTSNPVSTAALEMSVADTTCAIGCDLALVSDSGYQEIESSLTPPTVQFPEVHPDPQ